MKSFDSRESRSFSYFTAGIISLVLHLAVVGVLFVFARLTTETPPPPMTVTMLSEPQSAVPPKPIPPTPEPPKPEPPAIEPPAPEPPAPEPPKPEPPKPEPPKPEPPKPEPPKPEPSKPPKPEPVKVKEPVKEVLKPKPRPVSSVAERFKQAEVKTARAPVSPKPVSRPVSNPDDIRRRLTQGVLQQRVTTSSAYQSTDNLTTAQRVAAAESVDYANQVANPFISPIWQEYGPGKGELGNQLPNPVKVEFTVLEDGRIVGARITQRSNSEAMNQAVERLLSRLRRERLPSLPSVGVKSKSLSIVIFLETRS